MERFWWWFRGHLLQSRLRIANIVLRWTWDNGWEIWEYRTKFDPPFVLRPALYDSKSKYAQRIAEPILREVQVQSELMSMFSRVLESGEVEEFPFKPEWKRDPDFDFSYYCDVKIPGVKSCTL